MSPPDPEPRLRVDDFGYALPTEAIAQAPIEPRDAARLLVIDRGASSPGQPALAHRAFSQLGELLHPGDLLVVNDSRVLPARLPAMRPGGGSAEILLLRPRDGDDASWEALVRPSRRIPVGSRLTLRSGDQVRIGSALPGGLRAVGFDRDPFAVMDEAGDSPLPPYIRDHASPAERYQTVYARSPGSAAAPTAGLHFTRDLLRTLGESSIRLTSVTLHVGLDTFRPLEGEFVDEHRIHREWYEIPARTRRLLDETRRAGGRVVAVGTTSVRVLEAAARGDPEAGWTDLYITPPYPFQAVDALITNFHLPRSSLLLLVTAFVQAGMPATAPLAARDTLLAAYQVALAEGYRFFSFGDAMFIA
ncbi:MAG TPA: tRNA preQ1(34) S-adenosylmethionine ribosyltransferase-isomerase QueA [Candidatus Limnocylindria bacterium]|nr:tRNA preQ1(34) S-adenosylmethionine ribosyltransferase-isomerase QueA [Candidatus Limnocylindria bacterium]